MSLRGVSRGVGTVGSESYVVEMVYQQNVKTVQNMPYPQTTLYTLHQLSRPHVNDNPTTSDQNREQTPTSFAPGQK